MKTARKTLKGRLPKAVRTLKCGLCTRPISLKGDGLCIDCYLERIYKDCNELRQRVAEAHRRNDYTMGLINKAILIRDYVPSTPMTREERDSMYEFMGREGDALMDRLDWMFND